MTDVPVANNPHSVPLAAGEDPNPGQLPSPQDFRLSDTGPSAPEPAFTSYFGFEDRRQFFLPDGRQYIEYKVMTEGTRSAYQSATTRDMKVEQRTGDARLKLDPGEDRWVLLSLCVTGWNLVKDEKGTPAPFSNPGPSSKGSEFGKFYQQANPKIIADLEADIRKNNPWMVAEVSVADIDKQIEELNEERVRALEREAAKS